MAGMPNRDLRNTRNQAAQQRLFNQTTELPTSDLLPSPENGRKTLRAVEPLAEALKTAGMVQAMTVVTVETYLSHYPQHQEHVEASGKRYVVLHGHRRLAAAEMAGLEKVPVYLRKTVVSPRIAAIQENEQRLGLDPVEQGADYQAALEEEEISQRELARQLGGTSQTTISHKIKLLALIPPLRQAVVDHWLKKNGLEPEGDGGLLLPVKEAATVLAGLRPDLQQAFVDGVLSFDDAETIVKSKVSLEEQKLPFQETERQPETSKAQATADTRQVSKPETQIGGSGAEGEGDGGPADGDKNPVPGQRNSENGESGETGESRDDTPKPETQYQPETVNRGSGSGSPEPSGAPNNRAPEPAKSAVATLTDRGVIPVTTPKDIYTGLKERLSPEEFEELQDLILSD